MIRRPRVVENLRFDAVDDGYIVREIGSDWVHYLNPTAMLIVLQCDGSKSAEEIARFIQELHGLPAAPTQDVHDVVAQLLAQRVLRDSADASFDQKTRVAAKSATQHGEAANAQ